MPTLVWDQAGERFYEAGVDRGVLYDSNGNGVAWNGLISVNEDVSGSESSPIYYDGVKISDSFVPGDFAGSISAYTYPDEFMKFEGVLEVGNGLFVANQFQERFGLCYRVTVGNDLEAELAYKIHVLYNLTAMPAAKTHQSLSSSAEPLAFEWNVTAVPGTIQGFRPTAHLIFDTRKMDSILVQDVEDILYGDGSTLAKLPPIETLTGFLADWVIIRITDNLDGTWTATGPDSRVYMLDATEFEIFNANAVYIDGDTYIISSLTY